MEIREETKAEEEEDKKLSLDRMISFYQPYSGLIYAIILLQNHSTPVRLK